MEHGLQISLKIYALSMEVKMAAWSFLGALRIMGVLRSRFCRVLSRLGGTRLLRVGVEVSLVRLGRTGGRVELR